MIFRSGTVREFLAPPKIYIFTIATTNIIELSSLCKLLSLKEINERFIIYKSEYKHIYKFLVIYVLNHMYEFKKRSKFCSFVVGYEFGSTRNDVLFVMYKHLSVFVEMSTHICFLHKRLLVRLFSRVCPCE